MAKKKRAPQLDAWCWYCDREFEDEKVLIQHQKAKHFKCPHCPRRLNTAGGLAVHLGQVHKAEPGRLENTLPGRDSFEIEIYGMVGVPDSDLIAWQVRRSGDRAAQEGAQVRGPPMPKRPRIEKVALTADQLRAQLEAHKALMSGAASTSAPPHLTQPPIPATTESTTQSPIYHTPPTRTQEAASVVPASQPASTTSKEPPSMPPGPPPLPSVSMSGQRSPAAAAAPTVASTPAPPTAVASENDRMMHPHRRAIEQGLKSRLVYTDTQFSPEEKMAGMPRYAYVPSA